MWEATGCTVSRPNGEVARVYSAVECGAVQKGRSLTRRPFTADGDVVVGTMVAVVVCCLVVSGVVADGSDDVDMEPPNPAVKPDDVKLLFSTHSPRSAAAESKEEEFRGGQEDCSGEGVVVVVAAGWMAGPPPTSRGG